MTLTTLTNSVDLSIPAGVIAANIDNCVYSLRASTYTNTQNQSVFYLIFNRPSFILFPLVSSPINPYFIQGYDSTNKCIDFTSNLFTPTPNYSKAKFAYINNLPTNAVKANFNSLSSQLCFDTKTTTVPMQFNLVNNFFNLLYFSPSLQVNIQIIIILI